MGLAREFGGRPSGPTRRSVHGTRCGRRQVRAAIGFVEPGDRWCAPFRTATVPVEVSLQFLSALHTRWVALLRGMDSSDFARTMRHPEHGVIDLNRMLALYAWHSAHHTAHVTNLRQRMGW